MHAVEESFCVPDVFEVVMEVFERQSVPNETTVAAELKGT